MIRTLKYVAVAAVMAVLPMTASAAIVGDITTGNPFANTSFDNTAVGATTSMGDVVNLPTTVQAIFQDEAAGFLDFELTNTSGLGQNFAVASLSVLQTSAVFAGGITFEWLAGLSAVTIAEGDATPSPAPTITTFLAAGASDILRVTFGEVGPKGQASFDFTVQAVPLPASLLLFISALGGMGLIARRRKAAMA